MQISCSTWHWICGIEYTWQLWHWWLYININTTSTIMFWAWSSFFFTIFKTFKRRYSLSRKSDAVAKTKLAMKICNVKSMHMASFFLFLSFSFLFFLLGCMFIWITILIWRKSHARILLMSDLMSFLASLLMHAFWPKSRVVRESEILFNVSPQSPVF